MPSKNTPRAVKDQPISFPTSVKGKPLKIVIGINSLSSSPYIAYSNHISLFHKLGRWSERGGHQIALVNPERMSIDRMRNMCAKIAIENNMDYLLFIDDDVIVPLDFIDSLLECDADIVAGDVIIRGYPFNHMAFLKAPNGQKGLATGDGIQDLDKVIKEQKTKILDVGAVGFSLCLIKVSVLKKIAQPWFITGISNTEDIYFCLKAREYIPNLTVKLDTRIQCGHILWHEVISRSNKKDFARYIESQDPSAKTGTKKSDNGDRGDNYLKSLKTVKKRA